MIENLKKCEFKYTFRDYQKRVLDEVRVHLKDGKLNNAGYSLFGSKMIK